MQQNSDSSKSILIESDQWRVALEPESGLQTRFCKINHRGQWLDIMPDCSASDSILSASNFHMLPYSNRIRSGQFAFDGKQYQLENADAHAIHGALRKLSWRVVEQTGQSVTAEYNTQVDGRVNWPWPISAQVTYTVANDSLMSVMKVTNLGENKMPAGLGWHPYFCRLVAGASPQLTIPVSGVYPDTNGDCLPVGEPIALSEELNFTQARRPDPAQRIDHCLSGFTSPATLAWPEAGISLNMHASNNCTHLVLYNPDQPFFAVEPVTNANDGFNLAQQGIDAGVTELATGKSLQAEMRLQLTRS